jgi:ketosteroid isomerase-like protein
VCWVSPAWSVARFKREAVGEDGEQYAWTRLMVGEVRDGRLASMCEFELDDEQAAFAYAEERMQLSE